MSSKRHRVHVPVYIIALIIFLCLELLMVIFLQFMTFPELLSQLKEDEGPEYTATSTEPYLDKEEGVLVENEVVPIEEVLFEYVEVIDSCGPHFEGECVVVRSGPGTDYPVLSHLRNHVVLKVDGKVEREGRTWYKIVFDEWLRYPERVEGEWYVAADFVSVLKDEGVKTVWEDGKASTTKRIVVDRSEQKLYAYDGETLFKEISISTGLELSPTPRGMFTVFKKTPSRYMQGPLPGFSDVYDLPGVPWNLYFTEGGAVIHGAYWHDSFGSPYSHGCVNVPPLEARELYEWAELGMSVQVKD
ncbi:MAG TPA: L,D-transpeptidase family protein [Candidatus Paceibacterota bacterium]